MVERASSILYRCIIFYSMQREIVLPVWHPACSFKFARVGHLGLIIGLVARPIDYNKDEKSIYNYALILTKVYGSAKVQTLLAWLRAWCFKLLKMFNRAVILLLVKCYDKNGLCHPTTGSSICWLSLRWLTNKKKPFSQFQRSWVKVPN